MFRRIVEALLKSYRAKRKVDPFSGITALVETGDRDVSSRVYEILYE